LMDVVVDVVDRVPAHRLTLSVATSKATAYSTS
jgi:hypothetical protein